MLKMKKTKLRLTVCAILLAVILAFIWGNSALPAEDSGALSGGLWEFFTKLFPFLQTENGEHFLRKMAHFSEFAALGLCLCWLFGMLEKAAFLPFLWGAAAAGVDEIIQIFSPGRNCSIADVAIDCAGVLTGVVFLLLIHKIYKKTRC